MTVVIPGASRPQQASDNADVAALPPLAPETARAGSGFSTANASRRTSGDPTEVDPALPAVATRQFALFGPLHVAILFATLALPFALSRLTRSEQRPRLARVLALVIASVLLLDRVSELIWINHLGKITYWANALPMQLCDWASFVAIIALIGRQQLPYELAYLWGLAGTFQAVLTPDIAESPSSPLFISFFVEHCGIIVSALFLTWGLGMRPRPGAVLRVWWCSQIYVVCAGLADWLLLKPDPDFGYLAHKPKQGSLLDFFGRGRGTFWCWR